MRIRERFRGRNRNVDYNRFSERMNPKEVANVFAAVKATEVSRKDKCQVWCLMSSAAAA